MIEVSSLTKSFKDFTAVNHIAFTVPDGSIFAFLGPNGAGKTTTIKILTTLLRPDSGNILINGFDPRKNPDDVRRSFGIVFQDQSLDDELTAWENMEFHGVLYGVPAAERRKRIQELLHLVELADRQKHLVKTFSGGMKRRLEIARGLIHKPSILFLDEPTLGLDPQTRIHIWDYIHKLNREEHMTIFFTTHLMEEAERNASLIGIIDHGRIKTIGTVDQIKEQNGSATLEQAFIAITGKQIRDEEPNPIDRMRMRRKLWQG